MMWPLNQLFKRAEKRIATGDIAAAEARTLRFTRLMELDDMVRRSLVLLEPKKQDEPPAS